jgi:type IV pilus assembly protein PilB
VVSCPTRQGRKVVLHLQRGSAIGGLDWLDLTGPDAVLLSDLLTEPYGLVLAAGMSGKETAGALRAMLSAAAGPNHSVALIERAARLELEHISHCVVGEAPADSAVRAFSAADADVVVLDTIANAATARAVCLTGRDLLVLAGTGARGAAEAVGRLLEMDVAPWAMADSMLAVLQQHSPRRLCDACKRAVRPEPALLERLGVQGDQMPGEVYQPGSCPRCSGSGYVGRMSLRSVVALAGQPADLVRREAGPRDVRRAVEGLAGAAACRAGLVRVKDGRTSLEELARIVAG